MTAKDLTFQEREELAEKASGVIEKGEDVGRPLDGTPRSSFPPGRTEGVGSALAVLFCHHSRLPFAPEQVLAWHALPGAVERLTPPWVIPRIIRHGVHSHRCEPDGGDGTRVSDEIKWETPPAGGRGLGAHAE